MLLDFASDVVFVAHFPLVGIAVYHEAFVAPKAPQGKESNWIPTSAAGQFEVLFRLYGPEKPFFEKAWKLRDIEKES